jgi:hypothetical protein
MIRREEILALNLSGKCLEGFGKLCVELHTGRSILLKFVQTPIHVTLLIDVHQHSFL